MLVARHFASNLRDRRCISYTDLPTCCGRSDAETHCTYDSSSDSDGENPQPIKRSRSDQSLSATAQLAAAAAAAAHEGGNSSSDSAAVSHHYGLTSLQQPYGSITGAAACGGGSYVPQQFARAQRVPSLPVVLSDVGSSTNSLLSLESEAIRSASQQHLNVLTTQTAPAGQQQQDAAAQVPSLARSPNSNEASTAGATGSAAAAPAAAGVAALHHHAGGGGRQHSSSSGVLCSMNPVSSAASLTQAQLWGRGYDLTRTTSDASVSSGGYSAALQQLVADSPPLILSPGSSQALTESAGADVPAPLDVLRGASDGLGLGSSTPGAFKPGLSIQQQKIASFQGPSVPVPPGSGNVVVTAALGSSSWGMRPVDSRDSLNSSDSITSVEAGERLAGVRFGAVPRHAPGYGPQVTKQPGISTGAGQLPPLSPAQAPPAAAGGLPQQRSVSLGNLGAAALVAAPRAASSLGRTGVLAGSGFSPAMGSTRSWGGSSMTSPAGLQSEPSEALSALPGASPSIELQSMGSILGGDGQWLCGEASTGAIGALSPDGAALRQQEPQQQQLGSSVQGIAAAAGATSAGHRQQQPPTSVVAAAPVPVSAALPFTSSSVAPSCSLTIPPAGLSPFSFGFGASPAGTAGFGFGASPAGPAGFGFGAAGAGAAGVGFGAAPAGAAAAAAAAAAKLCLFDNGFARVPGAAQANGHSSCLAPPQQQPQSAQSSTGVSAPLPRMTSLPPKGALSGALGQHGLAQLDAMQQAPRPPQMDSTQWTFARRHASFDCARTSLSSRRRGSLELNMPWRKTLDAAIARVAAESAGRSTSGSKGSSQATGAAIAGARHTDADTAVEISVGEAEAIFGSGAVGPSWQRPNGASQLDLLMPLPEGDDESLHSPSACGPGSVGPGSMISGGRPSYDADVSSPASSHSGRSRSSSSSGGSVAADHDLPGSTNVGGYIGGSDSLGLSRHSLDSPRAAAAEAQQHHQHTSYGLEFDGAVMMDVVATRTTHKQQADEMQEQGEAAASHSDYTSDSAAEDGQVPSSSAPLHAQQLAGKRAAPEASRRAAEAAAEAAAAEAEVGSLLSTPTSALGLDGPMSDMHSSASASSISSRGSPAFFNRRGAGNGASRDLELLVRLNRARQTLDFGKRQAQAFAELDKAELTVWEALELLDGLREHEAGLLQAAAGSGSGASGGAQEDAQLTPDMSLKEHAFQVAELCRLSFPDKPYMALMGLLHGLGKLLAHPMWGSQPQWAVAGESFPIGCKFAPQISASEFFSANPDRRRRAYSTALGVYQEQCGLRNVYMSWGAAEYLYMLLVLNQTQLPEDALFMIRYQRCYALTRPGGAYRQLMTAEDRSLLPTLAAFQNILQYKRVALPPGALRGQQLYDYYSGLILTYLGEEALFW